jgi:hypothetical protein
MGFGRLIGRPRPSTKAREGSAPSSLSAFAADSNAAQAAVSRNPPTLTRRTPSPLKSVTVICGLTKMTLRGFGATTSTIALISSSLETPGA